LTPNTEKVGIILWKTGDTSGVFRLSVSNGGEAHSNLYDDEPTKHYLVGNILHSAINNDEPSIHTSLGDLIGHVALYVASSTPPVNYLECNGASISKTTYAALYGGNPFSIGARFGESGGNFYLPDFRGRAARGFDNGIGRDPDRLLRYADNGGVTGDTPGTMQNDEYKSHNHPPQAGSSNFQSSSGNSVNDDSGDQYGTFSNTGYRGGNETRMKNFSTMWIIRYQ
jgi:microcystin-dependent protein